jgi:hypothetical protein
LKKKTNRDPDDISLFNGRGFYPPEAEFQAYLKKVTNSDEVRLKLFCPPSMWFIKIPEK